ncbi:hypothetical protein ABT160_46130 [Streptomyces sp. NPDC001941]
MVYTVGQDAGYARRLLERATAAALPEEESLLRLRKVADQCRRP